MSDDLNAFQQIFDHYAEVFHDAPGARKLERLAKTAGRIPEPLLDDLAASVVKLDDVQLVGSDIHLALIDVGYCEARYHDATMFASGLRRRLESYVDKPDEAASMRQHYRERTSWWRMALRRAGELSVRWPALLLMNMGYSNG